MNINSNQLSLKKNSLQNIEKDYPGFNTWITFCSGIETITEFKNFSKKLFEK